MFGKHLIKSWSKTQSIISLSSAEAEYYGLVKATTIALGLQSMYQEFGIKLGINVKSDSKGAIGIAKRRGLGKVRHIDVHQLWIQQKVSDGIIQVVKVPGANNLADALTKFVSAEGMISHVRGTYQGFSSGRHASSLKV